MRLALAVAFVLIFTAPAHAQADPAAQADYARAAAYWGASPNCPNGPIEIIDQAFIAPNAELADVGGCRIWTGDYFASAPPSKRCAIRVHAWGHLIGRRDGPGAVGDPLNVMGSDAMPASCAALPDPAAIAAAEVSGAIATAAAAAKATAEVAWLAYGAAYSKWTSRRMGRFYCTGKANSLSRRSARVSARARCVQRFGSIGHEPTPPPMPEPPKDT